MTAREVKLRIRLGEDSRRQLQASRFLFADEMTTDVSLDQINHASFAEFYVRAYSETIEETGLSEQQLLNNLKLAEGDNLTLAGLLIFVKNRTLIPPQFTIKATSYYGIDKADDDFIDKENLGGTLPEQFKGILMFLKRNLKKSSARKASTHPANLKSLKGFLKNWQPTPLCTETILSIVKHVSIFSQIGLRSSVRDSCRIASPATISNMGFISNVTPSC